MQALKVGDYLTIVFTKVMDAFSRGLIDEDEDAEAEPTDRPYWEKKATKVTVGLADQMLEILRSFDPTLNLRYTKYYIGVERDGQPYNFVRFKPNKKALNFEPKLSQTDDLDDKLDNAGLDTLGYSKQLERYCLPLTVQDIKSKTDILKELSRLAYDRRTNV